MKLQTIRNPLVHAKIKLIWWHRAKSPFKDLKTFVMEDCQVILVAALLGWEQENEIISKVMVEAVLPITLEQLKDSQAKLQ